MTTEEQLKKKIADKTAVVGIIGLGYVGRALMEPVIDSGFQTIGFARSEKKVSLLNQQKFKNFTATTDIGRLGECDILLVCVQTPVDEEKKPDLSVLYAALSDIGHHLRRGQLVVIESSISVGTTRKAADALADISDLTLERDFFVAFSPERVDPGNKQYPLSAIPKVVSGFSKSSKQLAIAFYGQIMDKVVPVSTLETAEMVKLLENTFRLINITLVTEIAEYTRKRDIDIWEVIDAAATKPFGFLAHYPGPGIGGHCIPVDPYYLYEEARSRKVHLGLIKQAGLINDRQPVRVAHRAIEILDRLHAAKIQEMSLFNEYTRSQYVMGGQHAVGLTDARKAKIDEESTNTKHDILLIGVTYKPDIDDIRESAAVRVWETLQNMGHRVSYHDPYVSTFQETRSCPLEEIENAEMAIILTPHTILDYSILLKSGKPILDTRHVLHREEGGNVYYL